MLNVNIGETRIPIIQETVRNAIGGNMSLYGLGFGNDVDYAFLDVMSRENKGLARRIFTGSDATLQLQVESLSFEAVCLRAFSRSPTIVDSDWVCVSFAGLLRWGLQSTAFRRGSALSWQCSGILDHQSLQSAVQRLRDHRGWSTDRQWHW